MWDDIYNENFVDTLLLLSIPGLSIALTVLVVLANALVKRYRRRHRQGGEEPFRRMESAALESAAVAADGDATRNTRVRFGLQQSVSTDMHLRMQEQELEQEQEPEKKPKKKKKGGKK